MVETEFVAVSIVSLVNFVSVFRWFRSGSFDLVFRVLVHATGDTCPRESDDKDIALKS